MKNFSVNVENINYPSGPGNKFQLKLESNSEIEELNEIENFPKFFFKFISLSQVQNENKGDRVGKIDSLLVIFMMMIFY